MSSWIVPKFHYNGTDFTPVYPPVGKVPVDKQHAERTDSVSSSGLRQSITERIERVLTLDFPAIPESDLNNWDAFITWILGAGQFDYYPDSGSSSHNTYQVVDTDLGPERIGYQLYKITLNLRRVVSAQVGS